MVNTKLSKLSIIFLLIISLVLSFIPSMAFATGDGGTTGTDDDQSDQSGSGNKFSWYNFKAKGTGESSNWQIDDFNPNSPLTTTVAYCKDYSTKNSFDKGEYGSHTYWAACVVHNKKCDTGAKGWVNKFTGNNPDIHGNWHGDKLNNFFIVNNNKIKDASKRIITTTTDNQGKKGYYYKRKNGDDLTGIWIGEGNADLAITKTFIERKLVVTETSENCDPYIPPGTKKITTQKELKKLFKNPGKDKGTYEGESKPNQTKHSDTIEVKTTMIYKNITITATPSQMAKITNITKAENAKASNIIDRTINYTSYVGPEGSKTLTYETDVPTNNQVKFTPLNLNRSGYAKVGDGNIDDSYINNSQGKIQATINNKQGENKTTKDIGEEDISTLDINNDTNFAFKFDNDQLGIPEVSNGIKYDFLTKPDELKCGGGVYDTVPTTSTVYADNRNGTNKDGSYRYNLKFNASISNSLDTSDPTASLILVNENDKNKNEEVTSKEDLIKDAPFTTEPFKSGNWKTRFILSGNYTTDNQVSGSEVSKYWVASYTQAKYYEYGIRYSGNWVVKQPKTTKIIYEKTKKEFSKTDKGNLTINKPTLSHAPGASPVASNGGWTFNATVDKQHRGIYVGSIEDTYYQPLLYGHWNVKTLAGDTRK